ncbi:543_t:CDS:2, partial [Racocetra persica]
MENEDNSETLGEQSLSVAVCEQNSVEIVHPPVVGQIFGSWEELDHFVSLYAKSQNFVCITHESEYDNR